MKRRCFVKHLGASLPALSFYLSPLKKVNMQLKRKRDIKPRNVIFILSDDHRHDFMGFVGKVPWLKD